MPNPDSRLTSASLIERVRVDDSRAWRELVELYGPLIAHWCRRLTIPERAIGDCVQNVFLAVLKALDSFEPRQANDQTSKNRYGFRAWLWGITKHKCIDMLRSEGRHPTPAGGSTILQQINEAPQNETENWEEFTEPSQITELLQRAMLQVQCEFEPKTWQAFVRTTLDGIATAQVASELQIETATVRQYRSRVLRRLRRQLGETN